MSEGGVLASAASLLLLRPCLIIILFSRLPASTRRKQATTKRVYSVVVTAGQLASVCVCPGRPVSVKRRACASSVAVVEVWCGVSTRVLRVSPSARQPHAAMMGLQRGGRRATRKRGNGAGLPRAACLRRVSPRLADRSGWYLSETRSDVGSTGARSRLRKRAGRPRKPLSV